MISREGSSNKTKEVEIINSSLKRTEGHNIIKEVIIKVITKEINTETKEREIKEEAARVLAALFKESKGNKNTSLSPNINNKTNKGQLISQRDKVIGMMNLR